MPVSQVPYRRVIAAVAQDERQLEIISQLYEHELPHCGGDQRRTVANVNQAIARTHGRRGTLYRIPVDLLTAFQDAGLPILHALDTLEWSWDGLQEAKERFTPPPSQDDEAAIHERAVEQITAALHGAWREVLLRSPRRLRTVIRCAWRNRWKSPEGFRQALNLAAAFVDLDCGETELTVLFRAFKDDELVGLGLGISSGTITREEVLAIARSPKVIVGLEVDDQRRVLEGMVSLRGRVRPDRFLRTVQALGIDAAIALHALTSDPSVAMRADVVRQRHTLSLPQYLSTYEVMWECAPIGFTDYVNLTERWAPDALSSIYRAYPDTEFLRRLIDVGQAAMVERAARVGVSFPALSRFGESLLRYLKLRPEVEWCDAARAFERWNGDAARADAHLALPATLRDHPAIRTLVERGDDAVLRDQQLLKLVVTVADAGHVVDLELLREFQRVGAWPNSRSTALVYGIALQFQSADEMVDAAVRRAAEAYDRLSPRKCARAARDRGYFRYAVLGELPVPASAPVEVSDTPEPIAPITSGIKRVRRPSGPVVANDAVPPAGVVPLTDLRMLHEQLDLRGLVPPGTNSEHVAAVILHGFCDLGVGIPRAGRHYIVEQNARGRIRRRCDISEHGVSDAWHWLSSIKIIVGPRRRGGDWAYALDLRDDHEEPIALEVSRRIRAFLQRFREQTHH